MYYLLSNIEITTANWPYTDELEIENDKTKLEIAITERYSYAVCTVIWNFKHMKWFTSNKDRFARDKLLLKKPLLSLHLKKKLPVPVFTSGSQNRI